MIKIKIYGCSNDKVLKQCLSRASVFFLNALLPKKRNINIAIRIVEDLLVTENAYGECYNHNTKKTPSHYVIQLNAGMNPFETVSTLAHEMVHAKQFDKRELVFLTHFTRWKGERFEQDKIYTSEYPWEWEAERLEKELTLEFRKVQPEFNDFLGDIYTLK